MQDQPTIQLLKHSQVNKQKWDDCISNSRGSIIYATSFYLDNMCPGWNAIAAANYDWVMPLTVRTKLGIRYLYQPALTQQTGVFARDEIVNIPWKEILLTLQKHYRFWEISFNYSTPANIFSSAFSVTTATNFILQLDKDYTAIREGYHNDLKRNLKRSEKFRLVYKPLPDHTIAIGEYIKHYGERMKHVNNDDYDAFKKLAAIAVTENNLICRQVVNQQNELLATALLLTDGKRLYNMMNTTADAGRKVEANHFLIDSIAREFAGTGLVFDFEGSDLPGVKSFYRNFGAINQPYYMVKYNNLPWPINLLKR